MEHLAQGTIEHFLFYINLLYTKYSEKRGGPNYDLLVLRDPNEQG